MANQDGLIPGGEACIRQFFYGQRFYHGYFKTSCKEVSVCNLYYNNKLLFLWPTRTDLYQGEKLVFASSSMGRDSTTDTLKLLARRYQYATCIIIINCCFCGQPGRLYTRGRSLYSPVLLWAEFLPQIL